MSRLGGGSPGIITRPRPLPDSKPGVTPTKDREWLSNQGVITPAAGTYEFTWEGPPLGSLWYIEQFIWHGIQTPTGAAFAPDALYEAYLVLPGQPRILQDIVYARTENDLTTNTGQQAQARHTVNFANPLLWEPDFNLLMAMVVFNGDPAATQTRVGLRVQVYQP